MSDIKISVCIPVYGVEKYIERCIRSLWEQTMQDGIEFIFVNDCTKDKSIEIIEQVLEEYPHRKKQTTIIHHPKNSGLVAARNTALAHAKGQYIIHCDSDDWCDLDLYETMYNTAIENDADIVCCSHILEYDSKKCFVTIKKSASAGEYIHNHLQGNFFSLCTKLCKRNIVFSENFVLRTHIILGEDLLRCAQMFSVVKKIAFCENSYYHYFRGNTTSITRNTTEDELLQLVEIVNILSNISFKEFPNFLLWLKGFVLFESLKTTGFSQAKYWNLFNWRTHFQVLFLKEISFAKKMCILLANISFPLTNHICRTLLKFRR